MNFPHKIFTHMGGFDFTAEASTLGFPPGLWPYSFEIEGKLYEHHVTQKDAEGDVQFTAYIAKDGGEATIFND